MSPHVVMAAAKMVASVIEEHRYEVLRVEIWKRSLNPPSWRTSDRVEVGLPDAPEAVASAVAALLAPLEAPQARVLFQFRDKRRAHFTLEDPGEQSA